MYRNLGVVGINNFKQKQSSFVEMEQSKHGDGVTSVKVHHRPGGASSIQIGGGYGGEGSELDKKTTTTAAVGAAAATGSAADLEEEKKDDDQQQSAGAQGAAASTGDTGGVVGDVRRVAEGTSTVTDAFGNKVSGTSVRVRAPPGGASSITF